MIAVIKEDATQDQIDHLLQWLHTMNLDVHLSQVNHITFLGIVGDTSKVDIELLRSLDLIQSVSRITEPYKQANRKFHPWDTVVTAGSARIGGGHFLMIAGPCSVESKEQIIGIARDVKAAGAKMLRGGAYKPRSSPYSFQGLKEQGLKFLLQAKQEVQIPIITEIMDIRTLPLFEDVDMIQVGARNMQNFDLLQELGKAKKPVLLKRGLANTMEELLMSAEYIMNEGNEQVVLCERGIRTCETYTRNTLDLSSVPSLHELSHLPVIVDPSHGTGKASLVPSMAAAAAAAGADGIMIEVHNDPKHALCDGAQALTPAEFSDVSQQVTKIRNIVRKEVS